MVGKDAETMKQQRETFADSIKKFLGKPFSPKEPAPTHTAALASSMRLCATRARATG